MKRIIILLLCSFMVIGLIACGSENTQETSDELNIKIEDTGKNAPSEDLIMEDLQKALLDKNEFATLTEVETVKSLTEESTYEITLSITAETKYADWQYEAEMNYSKYDQGWIVDNVKFISENYSLMRIPSNEEMTELANLFFSTYEDYRISDLAGIENGMVASVGSLEDGQISFSWDNISYYLHGERRVSFTSLWSYDVEMDTWILLEEEYPDSYIFCGYEISEEGSNLIIKSDFSGEWKSENGNTITISNFTPESFVAEWGGNTAKFIRNAYIPVYFDTSRSNEVWYGDSEQGYYLCMRLDDECTSFNIFTYSGTANLIAMASVNEELPKLNDE